MQGVDVVHYNAALVSLTKPGDKFWQANIEGSRIAAEEDRLGLSPLAPWHYLTYHKDFHFDVQPLLTMGWRPAYSNDTMLRESYDWFTQNYDRLLAEKSRSAHRRPVKEKILWVVKKFS